MSIIKSTFARLFDFGYPNDTDTNDQIIPNVLNRFFLYNHSVSSFQEQYQPNSNTYHIHMCVDPKQTTQSTDNIVVYYKERRLLYYVYYYMKILSTIHENTNPNFVYPLFNKDNILNFEILLISQDDTLNEHLDELYNVHNTISHLQQLSKYNTDKFYKTECKKYELLETELVNKFQRIMSTCFQQHNYIPPIPIVHSNCISLTNHFIIIQNIVASHLLQSFENDYNPIQIQQPLQEIVEDITTKMDELEIVKILSSPKSISKSPKITKSKVKSPISKPEIKKNEYTYAGIQKLPLTKLIEICKEYNYKGYSGKKKDEVIRIILFYSVNQ
jgi:hypothetical protein